MSSSAEIAPRHHEDSRASLSAVAATWPHCPQQESRCANVGRLREPRPRPLCGTAPARRRGPGSQAAPGTREGSARRDPGASARVGGGGGARAERDRVAGPAGSVPRSGPPLKASFLLSSARRRPPGDPGGGAARRPYRPVPSHPPSDATPTRRNAQRAAGRQAHTSRLGGAAGGAGALRRARLKGTARLLARTAQARPWGGEGPESSGRARPHRPLEVWPAS